MVIALIISGVLILILLALITSYFIKLNEVRKKFSFALTGGKMLRIEYNRTDGLKELVDNFNSLISKYNDLHEKTHKLDEIRLEKERLSGSMSLMAHTLNQVNLLSDIGRKITSQLDAGEILLTSARVLASVVRLNEFHCLLSYPGRETMHYSYTEKDGLLLNEDKSWIMQEQNILYWSHSNKKVVHLDNATQDFAMYVSAPVTMMNGNRAQSVICVPFSHHDQISGCICIFSDKPQEYEKYIPEFIASLCTYLSVAIENSSLYLDIKREKSLSDELLLNILPAHVAEELKEKGSADPKDFEQVTVIFTDFKGFTKISEKMSPKELIAELNHCFSAFDQIAQKYGIEKIKTIGDAYMCAGGLPVSNSSHPMDAVKAGLEMRDFMLNYKKEREAAGKMAFEIRIGIHTGPVVAGIVGIKKFAYDIWGDTVNTASRMESSSEVGEVNISGNTYELVKEAFSCTFRGKIPAKNKGEIEMYFVQGLLG